MSGFRRGSEWNRWDLHLHTPETKKNDSYDGSTPEEKWNNFYTAIKNYIGDGQDSQKNISVIGITDYLSIKNYKRVMSDQRLPETVKLVIPNIEMRVRPIADNAPVNIHFLFNPSFVESLEYRFFTKLSFEYAEREFNASRDALMELGKLIEPGISNEAALKRGIDQFIPTIESVKKIFKDDKELRENVIIVVSNNRSDGASGITAHSDYCEGRGAMSQLMGVRLALYQFVDAVFSANPNDSAYFLGEKPGSDDRKVVKRKCGSLKPCIHGSDAHELSRLFEPDLHRYCWIKATPTFNGLRQILYEPKDRVRISELKPEQKPDYHVIEHVVIQDGDFQPDPIFFNDKLTCIIGGKSTGKSALLHNMAKAIDGKQVAKKREVAENKTKEIESMTVVWADGTESVTSEVEDEHKIVYVPQTYLNRLSDNSEEVTEIDDLIQEIVLLKKEAKEMHDQVYKSIQTKKQSITKNVLDFIQLQEDVSVLKARAKEIGNKKGIIAEIIKLKAQKDQISSQISLSEEDIESYDNAVSFISELTEEIELFETEMRMIDKIESIVEPKPFEGQYSIETKSVLNQIQKQIVEQADKVWGEKKKEMRKTLEDSVRELKQSLLIHRQKRDSLSGKINENESMKKLSDLIQEQNKLLKSIEEIEKEITNKESEFDVALDELSGLFDYYLKEYESYARIINENPEFDCVDLKFSVEIPFRTEAFCNTISKLFDKRTLRSRKNILNIDSPEINKFSGESLRKLIKASIDGTLPIVRGYSKESALRVILDDWYNITYKVIMDNDSIEQMSPGKKALVLLKLLINLEESKSPILIDQPEDDLDNRSVFDDLIPFIRDKKVDRQIIIVTHNANVVVGGDAEGIIIANQDGINAPNNKSRFEYRIGAIEENTAVFEADGNIKAGILNGKGIQQHICDVLEGGEVAFDLRRNKYHIKF